MKWKDPAVHSQTVSQPNAVWQLDVEQVVVCAWKDHLSETNAVFQPRVLAVLALQEQHAQHIQQNNIQAENIRSGVNMSNMSKKKSVKNEILEM